MATLDIGETLTIYEVESLKSDWLKQAKHAEAVALMGAHVTEVDGAGLQLLVSLRKWIEDSGGKVSLMTSSDVLTAALEDSGMIEWLSESGAA